MDERLIGVDELAEILTVPKSWIYGKTREKGPDSIPVWRVGKYCRFRVADVMAWLKKNNEAE